MWHTKFLTLTMICKHCATMVIYTNICAHASMYIQLETLRAPFAGMEVARANHDKAPAYARGAVTPLVLQCCCSYIEEKWMVPNFLIQSGGKWIYLKIVYVGFLDSSILYIYIIIFIYIHSICSG